MLGNAHRPQQAGAFRLTNHLARRRQLIHADTGQRTGVLQRERLERGAKLSNVIHFIRQELLVGIAVIEHVARHRRRPHHVITGLDALIEIGALGHFMPTRINHQQLLSLMLVRLFDVRGDHRVVLRQIATDNNDQRGFLQVFNRTRIAAVAHGAE